MSRMLAMFEPMILPRAISVLPLKALSTETTISGAEVPNATTVRPITIGDILNFCASEDAPDTKKSALFISMIRPRAINTKEIRSSIEMILARVAGKISFYSISPQEYIISK